MRKTLVFTIAVLMASPVFCQDQLSVVQRVSAASVRVIKGVGAKRKAGSGTVVRVVGRRAWVLTAAHVLASPGNVTVELVNPRQRSYMAHMVVSDEERDLAVLRFDADADVVALSEIGREVVGAEVVVSGYPLGGAYRSVQTTVKRSTIVDGIPMLVTHGDVVTGTSGGAVTCNGTIIGVASVVERTDHETWFANGESIERLLSEVRFEGD